MTFESAAIIIGLLLGGSLAGLAIWMIISASIDEGQAQREFELDLLRRSHRDFNRELDDAAQRH